MRHNFPLFAWVEINELKLNPSKVINNKLRLFCPVIPVNHYDHRVLAAPLIPFGLSTSPRVQSKNCYANNNTKKLISLSDVFDKN